MRHTSIPHFPVTAWKGSPGYIKHCQKMPKIWVGQTTINGEKKRGSPYSRNKFCSIYSHLVICFCGWQRNYTWSMTKAKINIWSVNFTEGKRDSQIHEPAWGVTYLLKYTRPVKFFSQFVKALIFSRNLYSRTEIWISPPFLLSPLLCLFKIFSSVNFPTNQNQQILCPYITRLSVFPQSMGMVVTFIS